MRLQLRSRNGMIVAGAGGVVLLLAAAWFLAISPQSSKATKLDSEISAEKAKIAERQAELARPSAQVNVRASDLYRLTKAMPDQIDMAGIILALNRLAKVHHLSLDGIQPGAAGHGARLARPRAGNKFLMFLGNVPYG